jgi:hypothetical protein
MNCVMALKVVCCALVPISPDNCDNTPGSDEAGRFSRAPNAGGSEPLPLTTRSMADATVFWLALSPAACSNASDSDSDTSFGV